MAARTECIYCGVGANHTTRECRGEQGPTPQEERALRTRTHIPPPSSERVYHVDRGNNIGDVRHLHIGGGGEVIERSCRRCGSGTHGTRDCTNNINEQTVPIQPRYSGNQRQGQGRERLRCHKCQEEGHFARECTNDRVELGRDNHPGHRGEHHGQGYATHSQRDSQINRAPVRVREDRGRERVEGDGRGGGGGGGRVDYVPDPVNEENLFDVDIPCGINFSQYPDVAVELVGRNLPQRITRFQDAGLAEMILTNVKKCEYKTPTPIQTGAIPAILSGRDLMGCAQTGSGKTAAYLVPVLSNMLMKGEVAGESGGHVEPVALVLSPTRELAVQIQREAAKFAFGTVIQPMVVYGGVSMPYQLEEIQRKGSSVIIATVGRLTHLINEGRIGLRRVRYLILDEADKMLSMGFEQVIRSLIQNHDMPRKSDRQTLMLSATFPREIQGLARDFLYNYITITVGVLGSANRDIAQTFLPISSRMKKAELKRLLIEDSDNQVSDEHDEFKTLVFVERKRQADFLASLLIQDGITCMTIHGDREQRQREEALDVFRRGEVRVLIATAVAARGLNIPNVDHVINFDLPQTIEEYVHRIGRTGRLGNKGKSTSFYDEEVDRVMAPLLIKASGGPGGGDFRGGFNIPGGSKAEGDWP